MKSLTQQDPCEWSTVKLVKNRIKIVEGHQGFTVSNLEACKAHVLKDLERLEQKPRERLEWSDTKLLRAIFVFIETRNWLRGDDNMDDDD